MREYMRGVRARAREGKAQPARKYVRTGAYARTSESDPRNPIYDPQRDPAPVPRDLTAFLMGDPPVGRSALDTSRPGRAG